MGSKARPGYGTHSDYMSRLEGETYEREKKVGRVLRDAFSGSLTQQPADVISFADVSVESLGKAIANFPDVLKPLLIACNVAGRAIERDLDIKNLDTYSPLPIIRLKMSTQIFATVSDLTISRSLPSPQKLNAP